MKTLAFDGRMGASGDMLLAALLAAGADRDALAPVEAAPSLDVTYAVRTVEKTGISATAVDVLLADDADDHDHSHDHHDHTGDGTHDHSPDPEHGHGEDGDGSDEHAHTHDGEHTHAEGHGPHRTYSEV